LEIAHRLEPFVSSPRGKTALRTTQLAAGTGKKMAFGKLGWDLRSHKHWTHFASADYDESSAQRLFLSTEAWTPSWTQCVKDDAAPDFYMSLYNAHSSVTHGPSQFSAILLIALSALAPDIQRAELRTAVISIARHCESPLCVWKRRSWGRQVGTVGFTEALNDLGLVGLFKPGDRHRRPLDLSTFADEWAPLEI
jgi:hypothetical protein